MRTSFLLTSLFFALFVKPVTVIAQEPSALHNPKIDLNISPQHNKKINPEYSAGINPQKNRNINPFFNKEINPVESTHLNPKMNDLINPLKNQLLNPLLYKNLYPTSTNWSGFYIYDGKDNLLGYITRATKDVLICFDLKGTWTCYYVLTNVGTYNHFDLNGEWTGDYICSDSNAGFNAFNKEGIWTGKHIK